MDDVESPIFYTLVDEVVLNVYVFSAIVVTGFLGEIDGTAIVKKHGCGIKFNVVESQFNE